MNEKKKKKRRDRRETGEIKRKRRERKRREKKRREKKRKRREREREEKEKGKYPQKGMTMRLAPAKGTLAEFITNKGYE